MKRFYKTATAVRDNDHWAIELDGRAVKTPARNALLLPTDALAAAIADEWNGQGEKIDPASMPLTGLANAAIDHVMNGDRRAFVAGIAVFGESDLVCYRTDTPADLAARQAAAWDPLIGFVARRYDATLATTASILHTAQPPASLERLRAALDAQSDFALAAMQPLTTISGSLVIALALADGEIDAPSAFTAGHIDELYQAEKWGDDAEARDVREKRQAAFNHAARFLSLL